MTASPATHLDEAPLTLHELALAVGAEEAWIVSLVEVARLHVPAPAAPPARWRFGSPDLQRALAARRLQRDFDANLDTAALVLDLQSELRRLRALVAAHGLR